jgi:amidase
VKEESFKPLSGHDTDNHKLYDAAEFHGVPISLQLVGRRFEDEKVLKVLQLIKEKIGLPFDDFP